MSNFKKISIYQIDKLALNLEPELFMIKKEAGKEKIFNAVFNRVVKQQLRKGFSREYAERAAQIIADDAVRAAEKAAARKAREAAARKAAQQALAKERAARKAAERAAREAGVIAPTTTPTASGLVIKNEAGNIIGKYEKGVFKLDPKVNPNSIDRRTKALITKQIQGHEKAIKTAVEAAAKQAAAIAKVEKDILASVQGTNLTDKAKKGAIGLGVLSALYFMLSGSSPSTEGNEADVQKIVQSSISGVPKEDTSIINNTITSIDSLSSALNRLEKSPEIEENISDLQSVKSALAKCNKQINVKESFAYASTLREAENTARSYLPKLENLIPSLNQEDLTLAKNVQNNLNVFLGTVTAAREKI